MCKKKIQYILPELKELSKVDSTHIYKSKIHLGAPLLVPTPNASNTCRYFLLKVLTLSIYKTSILMKTYERLLTDTYKYDNEKK